MLRRTNKVIPAMIARWDVLVLAAVLSGGSMMIENSHRVDTGLADDAAAALPACTEAVAVRADTASASDDANGARYSVSAAADDDAVLNSCD